jgi:hypothetical protein
MGKVTAEKRIFPVSVEIKRFVRDIAGKPEPPAVSGFSSSG